MSRENRLPDGHISVAENMWAPITTGSTIHSDGFDSCIPSVVYVNHLPFVPTPYFIHMTGSDTYNNFKNRIGIVTKACLFVGMGRHEYWNNSRILRAEQISSRFAVRTHIQQVHEFNSIQLENSLMKFYLHGRLVDEAKII
ncbi:hypothetical protein KBC80_04205 [Candidatus Woesebacteria bacterium]|nr:hypothetical protein [Candidatus Woesebacteria bacterium]